MIKYVKAFNLNKDDYEKTISIDKISKMIFNNKGLNEGLNERIKEEDDII